MEYLKKLLKSRSFPLAMILSALALINACSANKAFEQGYYEVAIKRAISKLDKNPNHFRSQEVLNLAYNQLTEKYYPKIEANKNKNTAESWEVVYKTYQDLNDIQKSVKGLESFDDLIKHEDFSSQIEISRTKSASMYYAQAQSIIEEDSSKEAYQEAYTKFLKVNSVYPGYNDTRDRINECRKKGTYHVLIRVKNPNNLGLPPGYEKQLLNFKASRLNKGWVEFHGLYDLDRYFDYTVELALQSFSVSKNDENKKKYNVEKEVLVKYVLVKDAKGNIVKDEKGNAKKRGVYDTKKASVVELERTKTAEIRATLLFIDNYTMNTFKTFDVKGRHSWSSKSASFKGSPEAISDEVLKLTKRKIRPFPSYENILLDACGDLRSSYVFRLSTNRKLFDK